MSLAAPSPDLAAEAVRLMMLHALHGYDLPDLVRQGVVAWPDGGRGVRLDDRQVGDFQLARAALIAAGVAKGEAGSPRYELTRDFAEIGPLFEEVPMAADIFLAILRAMIDRAELPTTRKPFEPQPAYGRFCALLAETGLLRRDRHGFLWTDAAAAIMGTHWEGTDSLSDRFEIQDAADVERMWQTLPEPIREMLFPSPPHFRAPGWADVAMVIGTYWRDGWDPWPWDPDKEASIESHHSRALIARYRKAHGVEEAACE